MKRFFIFFIVLFSNIVMFAQNQNYNIRSRVLTLEDSIPVSFATVRLMQTDSVMVGSTLTDLNGLFGFDTPLKEGMFLSISSVGCKTTDVILPCDTTIYIESTNKLAEVVVREVRDMSRERRGACKSQWQEILLQNLAMLWRRSSTFR